MVLFQKLWTETEKKLNEGQPVKQSKNIIIQEVEDDEESKDEDVTEAGLYPSHLYYSHCLKFLHFFISPV